MQRLWEAPIFQSAPLMLEEDLAGIGAVNIHVTGSTGLIFRRLIVCRANRRLGGHATQRQGMALQAKNIDLAHPQQPWIRRTVRHVTTGAALGFYGQVLIHKGTFCVGMALEADLILGPTGPQLFRQKTAVRIVAVVAAYQFLVHAMPIRPREFRSLLRMALVAQPGGRLNQQ
jgi:hypothetical protein